MLFLLYCQIYTVGKVDPHFKHGQSSKDELSISFFEPVGSRSVATGAQHKG